MDFDFSPPKSLSPRRRSTATPRSIHRSPSPAPPASRSDRFRSVVTPTFDNRRRRSVSRGSTVSPARNRRASSRTPEPPSMERNTKIQVCVRVRPILPSDNSIRSSPTSSSLRKSHSQRSPPMPEDKRKGSNGGTGGGMNRHSSIKVRMPKNSRDLLPTIPDGSPESEPCWEVSGTTVSQAPHTNPDAKKKSAYTFDHSFGPSNTNAEMYRNIVKDTVTSSMEGYHASVFAYGQTATGKTFTMTGAGVNNLQRKTGSGGGGSVGSQPYNEENSLGIIQLAIQDCFNYINNQKNETREYLLRVSFMEIYNEVINDLLATPSRTQPLMSMGNGATPPPPSAIRIFESKNEGVVVRGVKEEIVTCPEQVFALLAAGERRRHTGSTVMNKQSSRSHSIFRLIVESRRRVVPNVNTNNGNTSMRSNYSDSSVADSIASSTFQPATTAGPVRVSTLSLVDLAGSESVKNTGATGSRQKEGQYINKSLLTLGHVVYKLAELSKNNKGSIGENATAHIPYRDSKLTRLLQPSLSGNAQICLICNISPLAKHIEESHLTLKFASRAKRIKQHARITEVVNDRTLLENYREEIEDLKQQLKVLREAQEAKEAQQSMKNEASGGAYAASMDENDAGVLTQAIGNLERLILKTATAEEKKRRKKRREAAKIAMGEQNLADLGIPRTISHESADNGGGDPLLDMLDQHGDMDDPLLSKSSLFANKSSRDDFSVGSTSLGDESTIVEGRKLVTELHRIQGLLGSVLVKKGSSNLIGANSPNIMKSPPMLPRVNKNEEVERLRAQLHEQAVHTSLRKADSTFLQAQLQEKDVLLKDISQILDAVEQRQIQLENENEKLKREWEKTMAALRSKESESLILEKLMKKRENEIKRLREQLGK